MIKNLYFELLEASDLVRFGLLLAILGVLLTIGLFLYDYFERKKYPGRIGFVELNLVNLLSSIADGFKDIKLLDGNQSLKKDILYLKAVFINNGSIDLESTATNKRSIQMKLPQDYVWYDANVKASSAGIDAQISISDEHSSLLQLNFDLLRKDECITIETLIELPPNKQIADIRKDLKFNHRIAQTASVKVMKNIGPDAFAMRRSKHTFIFMFTFLVTFMSATMIVANKYSLLSYKHKTEDVATTYRAKMDNEKKVVLIENNTGFMSYIKPNIEPSRTITAQSFASDYEIVDSTSETSIGGYYIIILVMTVIIIVEWFRFYKVISANEKYSSFLE